MRGFGGAGLEALEPRRLMSAGGYTLSFDADSGILTVRGTEGADVIEIYQDTVQSPDKFAGVRGIVVEGMGGNDCISVYRSNPDYPPSYFTHNAADDDVTLDIPVTIDGGAGDDDVYAESSVANVLIGGAGRDSGEVYEAGDNLFSLEMVMDHTQPELGEGGRTFMWAQGGEHLFTDPFVTRIEGGTYYGEAPEPTPLPVPPDGHGEKGSDEPVVAPAVVLAAPPWSPFAVVPVGAPERHVWEDAA